MTQTYTPTSSQIPTVGNDAIEILVNDHQRIKALLKELTEGGEGQRSSTLEALKEILTVHNSTEENLVYPAIQEIAGRKMHAKDLYHETAEADVALWQLSMMSPQDNTFKATAPKCAMRSRSTSALKRSPSFRSCVSRPMPRNIKS